MQPADLDRLMAIWLTANLEAHSFIAADYWQDNLAAVRQMIPQAEVYVYQRHEEILGFIGLADDYIAGIFVDRQARGQGIGKQLLEHVKTSHGRLTLQVYQQNIRAVQFYQRENFQIHAKQLDEHTGVPELEMLWQA